MLDTFPTQLSAKDGGLALLSTDHGYLGATLTLHQSSPAPGNTRTDNIYLVKLTPHTAPHVPAEATWTARTRRARRSAMR
jgi:hypothetical protein